MVFASILSVVLALVFLLAGGSKLSGSAKALEQGEHLGFSAASYRSVGLLEVVGAAGLIAGVFYPLIGAVSAVGLTLLLVGALVFHLRASDPAKAFAPAIVIGALSAATAALLVSGSLR